MENFSIVNTWEHRRTLPELLFDRQLRGKRGTFGRRVGQTTPSFLAYRAGWNPTRLQNMILAVGPGTPASVLKKVSTMDNMSTDEDFAGFWEARWKGNLNQDRNTKKNREEE